MQSKYLKKSMRLLSVLLALVVVISGVFTGMGVIFNAAADNVTTFKNVHVALDVDDPDTGWRLFSCYNHSNTLKGMRVNASGHFTMAADGHYLRSLELSYRDVTYELSRNVRDTDVDANGYLAKNDSIVALGQTITLPQPLSNPVSVNLLAVSLTSVNRILNGTGFPVVANYSDGSSTSFDSYSVLDGTLELASPYTSLSDNIAYATYDLYQPNGNQYYYCGGLTPISVPLESGKVLTSITLPDNDNLAIAAITVQVSASYAALGIGEISYTPIDMSSVANFKFFGGNDRPMAVDKLYPVTGYDANGVVISNTAVASDGTFTAKPAFWGTEVPFKINLNTANNNVWKSNSERTLVFGEAAGNMRSLHLLVVGPHDRCRLFNSWVKVSYSDGSESYHSIYSTERFNNYNCAQPDMNVVLRGIEQNASNYENVTDMVILPDMNKVATSITLMSRTNDDPFGLIIGITAEKIGEFTMPEGLEPSYYDTEETLLPSTKQIKVDVTDLADYRIFTTSENVVTLDGMGGWHETYSSDPSVLKSTDITFRGIEYTLSPNVRETDNAKKDSILMEGQDIIFKDGERTEAQSVNFLFTASTTPKRDVSFRVYYTDGTYDETTLPYVHNMNGSADPNAAYLQGHNHFYRQNNGQWEEGTDNDSMFALVAASVKCDPTKQIDRVTLPRTFAMLENADGTVLDLGIYNDCALVAMTIESVVNRYEESDPQLRGYASCPINFEAYMNSSAIASSHTGGDASFGDVGGICAEHLSVAARDDKDAAVYGSSVTDDSFISYDGNRFVLAGKDNSTAYTDGNARSFLLSSGQKIPFNEETRDAFRSIHLLVTATGGTKFDWVELKYSDGTSSLHNAAFLDWHQNTSTLVSGYPNNIMYFDVKHAPNIALVSDIAGTGAYAGHMVNIYDVTLTPDEGKVVTEMILPKTNDVALFGITVEKPVYGEAYGADDKVNTDPAANRENLGRYYTVDDLPYNVDAFADDENREDGSFDGNSSTMPCDGLGETLTFRGVPYKIGPLGLGEKNAYVCNNNNRTLALSKGKYSSVSFMYLVYNGNHSSVPISLCFDDGSVSTYDLGHTTDWTSHYNNFYVAYAPGYSYQPDELNSIYYTRVERPYGGIVGKTVYLTPEDAEKTLVGIRMPKIASRVYFAITLYGIQDAIDAPGGDENNPNNPLPDGGNVPIINPWTGVAASLCVWWFVASASFIYIAVDKRRNRRKASRT